jgi:hypothetical protein
MRKFKTKKQTREALYRRYFFNRKFQRFLPIPTVFFAVIACCDWLFGKMVVPLEWYESVAIVIGSGVACTYIFVLLFMTDLSIEKLEKRLTNQLDDYEKTLEKTRALISTTEVPTEEQECEDLKNRLKMKKIERKIWKIKWEQSLLRGTE